MAVMFCCLSFSGNALAADSSLLQQAIEHYQFQDFESAEKGLMQVLQSEPDNPTAHYYLGLALHQNGKAAEAVPHLEKAAQSDNPPEGIRQTLANAYLSAGQPEKALPYFQEQHQASPDDEAIAFQYASALQSAGREGESSAIYRSLIEKNGDYASGSRYQLGSTLTEFGAYSSAVEMFKAIDPKSAYGEAAKMYIEALNPVTRPLNTYASVEYFYNDNPASSSSTLTGTTTTGGGSLGATFIAQVSTRAHQINDRLQAKLSYLYYGTFYAKTAAKDSDFVGHFINPSLNYHITAQDTIEIKGDVQFFYFNQQKLGTNYGGTITGTHNYKAGHSTNVHAGIISKSHNSNYNIGGAIISLKYLDGLTWSAGAGGTFTPSSDWGGNLSVDYTFNDEHTKSNADATVNAKASDSRAREHSMKADLTLPLTGMLSRISVIGNVSYSYKSYLNSQSGNLYDDVTGSKITFASLTWGAKLQAALWKKYNLNLVAGLEKNKSRSHTSSLTYESNRYYAQLTAYY